MFRSSYFIKLQPVKSMKKIILGNGSVALKWEHPHGFMEVKMYLYKVEVNGETRFFRMRRLLVLYQKRRSAKKLK